MMTKIHVKQAIVINLPAEDIFAYLSNLENLSDWSSVIISTQSTSSAEVTGVGTTAKSTIRFLGNRSEMMLEVVECEPTCFLTIKSTSGLAPCLFHYQFEQLQNGGTNIVHDALISLIGKIGDQAEQVVINAMRRDAEHDLLTLKDMLESNALTYFRAARA